MKYHESQNGYFYKEYKNGKKTRISKNEYETKGGGNGNNSNNNRKKSINALRELGKNVAYTEGLSTKYNENLKTNFKTYDPRKEAIKNNMRRGVQELSIPTESYGFYAPGDRYKSDSGATFLNTAIYTAKNLGALNARHSAKHKEKKNIYAREYGYKNVSENIERKSQVAREAATKAKNNAYEAFRQKVQRGNVYGTVKRKDS